MVWKDIPGYEGIYKASNLGQIMTVKTVRIRKLIVTPRGYKQVGLSRDGVSKTFRVHTLVALSFYGPRPDGLEVRHLNGDKLDNRLVNLKYGTRSENRLDIRQTGGDKNYRAVRRSDGKEYISVVIAAEDIGRHPKRISEVCKGRQKTTGGFGWSYI